MSWDKVAKVIAKGAPVIASVLGSPLAGAAVGVLASTLTGNKDATANDVMRALQSPDAMEKIRQIDKEWDLGLKGAGLELVNLERLDRENARAREVELVKSGIVDWVPKFVAIAVVISFVSLIAAMFGFTMPEGMRDVAMLLLGTLAGSFSTIISYYFGSSASSRQKDELLKGAKM